MLVRSCALQHLPSWLFPFALGLMLTCMYTGDKSERTANVLLESGTVQMDNIERVKILFAKLHSGFVVEAEVVAKLIPRLLVDFFAQEQAMSLILGEFVRTSQQQRPELVANILFDVIEEYRCDTEKWDVVIHWISLCLKNFIQMEPIVYSLWAMSCLFICVSDNLVLRKLYPEIANDSSRVDEDLFLAAAVEFYTNQTSSSDAREAFLAVFDSSDPISLRLIQCCRKIT